MSAKIEPRGTDDVADLADTVAELLDRGLVREAEVAMAFLALWLLDRVEAGRATREEADRVFTTLDARLSERPGAATLSDTSQELVIEGEHFHHFGDTDDQVSGPDPAYFRQLAYTILQGDAAGAAQ